MKIEDWSDTSTRQGMPEIAGKPPNPSKRQGKEPTGFSGSMARPTG